ncbi:MAG TPA: transcriptional regulator [Syntrophomonas sp.]|nr:transcriptional regulator [Syntrophomonas sp.]HCF70142.1 transcriptional regulator [Syntrophomonas sp.]
MDSNIMAKATFEQLKCGFTEDDDHYICLLCGKKIEKGVIYPEDGILYEAEKYMRMHIQAQHQSVFAYLIDMDKKITGLSEHQANLLKLFYEGKSDSEIQKELDIGSSSTIRNHRFSLKEKERQAKVFLVLMDLLQDKISHKHAPDQAPAPAGTDKRYAITAQEREKIIKKYFLAGPDGPLKTLSMKEKSRLVVLDQIAGRFEASHIYSEKEINSILMTACEDYITLRRYLVDYGFLERKPDGSQYRLKSHLTETEDLTMDQRKELKQQYKDLKTEAGVYQIRNTENQKVFVIATPNLRTINGKHFELQTGGNTNKELQEDWNRYGEETFAFEVLEVLEEPEEGFFDKKDALKKLEQKWLDRLQPYGDRGYNKKSK